MVGEAAMLGNVMVWLALQRDKRGLMVVGVFLLLVFLAVLAWNLSPY